MAALRSITLGCCQPEVSWHAISFDRIFIEDLSRNGACLNDWNNRIGGGLPPPLKAGDILFIDPYQIEVSLEAGNRAVRVGSPGAGRREHEALPEVERRECLSGIPFSSRAR